MGSVYNTPYKINDGFYSIGGVDGEKQYWNVILSAGYGKQLVQSISIGNEAIKTFTETAPQSGVYDFEAGSLYYDKENKIEIAQGTEFTLPYFTQKVKGDYSGEEIKHEYGEEAVPLILQCVENTMRIEVCVQFNGLRKFNDNDWREQTVTIIPEWSNDSGKTWHQFSFENGNTFKNNTKNVLRYTATATLTHAQCYGKQLSVRLTRTTEKAESNSQESAYCLYVNSFCYDAQKSAGGTLVPCAPLESPFMEHTTRIGVRIVANENTSDFLDQINALCYGLARTWSAEKTTTRNVANWILEVLESDTHIHSQFKDDEIDLASFGALYEYCEEEGFYCDGIVSRGEKKEALVSKLLTLCNALLILDTSGKLAIIIDKQEEVPVALLNAQSIKSVTVTKSFDRQPDGIKAQFTNRDAWQTDTMYVMRDGGAKGDEDTCTELALEFATEAEHVYKICQRKMRQEILQPREVSVHVGREGDYYPLYATILLQLEQLRHGLSSAVIHKVWRNDDGNVFRLDVSDLTEFYGYDAEPYIDENGEAYTDEDDDEPYIWAYEIHTDENGNEYHSDIDVINPIYGIVIQAQDGTGKRHISSQIYGFGRSRRIRLMLPLNDSSGVRIQEWNILSTGFLNEYGEFDRITNTMKITAAKPDGDGWELTLKDYNPAIYEYGDIPEYKTNLTTPPTGKLPSRQITNEAERAERERIDATTNAAITKARKDAIDAGTTRLDLSATEIKFHLDGEKDTLYAETQTIVAALMLGDTVLTPDKVTAASSKSSVVTASAALSGNTATITIKTVRGAKIGDGVEVTVKAEYNELVFAAKCSVTASDTGTYLKVVKNVNELPAAQIGDFITWLGDDYSSNLVEGGRFYKSQVYRYVGAAAGVSWVWQQDDRIEHNSDALGDVLKELEQTLAKKNDYATQYANTLAVSKVFIDRLIANEAGIENLMTRELILRKQGQVRSENFKAGSAGWAIHADGTAEFAEGTFRGVVNATSGSFQNCAIDAKSLFQGSINMNGALLLQKDGVAIGRTFTFVAGEKANTNNNTSEFVNLDYDNSWFYWNTASEAQGNPDRDSNGRVHFVYLKVVVDYWGENDSFLGQSTAAGCYTDMTCYIKQRESQAAFKVAYKKHDPEWTHESAIWCFTGQLTFSSNAIPALVQFIGIPDVYKGSLASDVNNALRYKGIVYKDENGYLRISDSDSIKNGILGL